MAAVSVSDSHQGNFYTINKNSYEDVNTRFKVGAVTLSNATTSAMTVSLDLEENWGIKKFMGIRAWQHTTEDSVIIPESGDGDESVTAVVNNTLTITVNGTAVASKRFYLIYGL